MGFATKVQLIKRKLSEQWYINFPSAVAQAMEFKRGETVEWVIEDKAQLVLNRLEPPESALKKKRSGSTKPSGNSGKDAGGLSSSSARS
jgi:bifunctional DNA-binding transcriptional regulator/antitoxin component of YhaV-PrlF toxin-antitoxin module